MRGIDVISTTCGASGGQSIFERDLIAALMIEAETEEFAVRAQTLMSVRGMPSIDRAARLPTFARRGLGLLYLSRTVHRLDLRAPPAAVDIVTLHDLAPLKFEDEASLRPQVWSELRRAAMVVTGSSFAQREIEAALGVAARVVPHGVPSDVGGASRGVKLRNLSVRRPFVLQVGGATTRKNLALLADAWRHVDMAGTTLVSVGPMRARRAEILGAVPGVVILDELDRQSVLSLIAEADALLVPSSYEGFGLPLLEAMAMATPFVATDIPVFREVGGPHALLAPLTAEGFAQGIARVLAEGRATVRTRRLQDRAATYTWERAARSYVQLYRESSKTTGGPAPAGGG